MWGIAAAGFHAADECSSALIIDAGETLSRVIVPDVVLNGRRELMCVGRPVAIFGHVDGAFLGPRATHVATELRFLPAIH